VRGWVFTIAAVVVITMKNLSLSESEEGRDCALFVPRSAVVRFSLFLVLLLPSEFEPSLRRPLCGPKKVEPVSASVLGGGRLL
jgi:hypothetical protein